MSDDTTKAKDEKRARELLDILERYHADGITATMRRADIIRVCRAFDDCRAERDAELQRAMVVTEAAIDASENSACPFCPGRRDVMALGVGRPHDPDCPLVSQAFITPTGERK